MGKTWIQLKIALPAEKKFTPKQTEFFPNQNNGLKILPIYFKKKIFLKVIREILVTFIYTFSNNL